MSANDTRTGARQGCRRWNHGLAALALAWGGTAWSQVVAVPAAHLNHAEGSVAVAPQGEKEWHDVQPRRVLKRGDRLWTDRGSRAEVQAGGHALRLNGETQLVLENVGETATQLSLTQGSVVATVTRMNPGDSFEVGTPNLAFRARQPGDYRIDVDAKQGLTRIVVVAGSAVVFGERGEALEVRNGQRVTFRERTLARVQQAAFAATDDFDRWAGARRRGEPTVSMPLAAAPTAVPAAAPMDKGRTIIIPGGPLVTTAKPAPAAKAVPAVATAPAVVTPAPATPVAVSPAPVMPMPSAKPIPTTPMAAPLRVTAPAPTVPLPSAAAQAEAQARALAAREQEERARLAQQRAEDDRRAAAARAERAERAEREKRAAAAEAKRAEERKRAVAAKREEDRRQAKRADEERTLQAKRAAEDKRLAFKRADEERRHARRAAEEKRIAAARQAEAQKLAEQARRKQLARLQEQAHREEQAVQARREQAARRAEEERREEAMRREDQARREEQARRDDDLRRQRALADQWRRDQERRDQEVWLRQQQQLQPVRPAPMGVPARRVS